MILFPFLRELPADVALIPPAGWVLLGCAAVLGTAALALVIWLAPHRPLLAGVALTILVTAAWTVMAYAATGPTPLLRWSWGWRGAAASYVQAWQSPTGSGWDLFGVTAGLFAVCRFRYLHRRARGRR